MIKIAEFLTAYDHIKCNTRDPIRTRKLKHFEPVLCPSSAQENKAMLKHDYTFLDLPFEEEGIPFQLPFPPSIQERVHGALLLTSRHLFLGISAEPSEIERLSPQQLCDAVLELYRIVQAAARRAENSSGLQPDQLELETTLLWPSLEYGTPASSSSKPPRQTLAARTLHPFSKPVYRAASIPFLQAVISPSNFFPTLASMNDARAKLKQPLPPLAAVVSKTLSKTTLAVERQAKRAKIAPSSCSLWNRFTSTAVGGTFDRLHSGHKILLSSAALLARQRVVVGISGDALLKKKSLASFLQPISGRIEGVHWFLSLAHGSSLQYELIEINDPCGPAATDPKLDALIISEETRQGGTYVNKVREANGLPPLTPVVIGLITEGDKISSKATSTSPSIATKDKISSSSIRKRLQDIQANKVSFLRNAWKLCFASLHKLEEKASSVETRWWKVIQTRYTEDRRAYHTLNHLFEMLHRAPSCNFLREDRMRAATFFHDIIYDPRASDNEEKSEVMFKEFAMEACVNPEDQRAISTMILDTKKHQIPKDVAPTDDRAMFLDLDLSILGSHPLRYSQYAKQIKIEYKHVADEIYREKRPLVLRSLLNYDKDETQTHIFFSPTFRQRYEVPALLNVLAEIEQLSRQ